METEVNPLQTTNATKIKNQLMVYSMHPLANANFWSVSFLETQPLYGLCTWPPGLWRCVGLWLSQIFPLCRLTEGIEILSLFCLSESPLHLWQFWKVGISLKDQIRNSSIQMYLLGAANRLCHWTWSLASFRKYWKGGLAWMLTACYSAVKFGHAITRHRGSSLPLWLVAIDRPHLQSPAELMH